MLLSSAWTSFSSGGGVLSIESTGMLANISSGDASLTKGGFVGVSSQ